jgi:hypothetical protein
MSGVPSRWQHGLRIAQRWPPSPLWRRTSCLAAAQVDEIKKRGYMVVATNDFQPFEFVQDGKPIGFDNELLLLLKARALFEVRQEIIPWTGLLTGVTTEKYNVALTAVLVLVTKETNADCRRYALLRQARERQQHQGNQGPQRQDSGRPGGQRPAAVCARTGGDARQDHRVHLVSGGLSGPHLPLMSGFEVLAAVSVRRPGAKMVPASSTRACPTPRVGRVNRSAKTFSRSAKRGGSGSEARGERRACCIHL